MLKVNFVGAVEDVSGSCTWLHHTDSDTQFLVDCGMNQGSNLSAWKNNQPFPFDPKQIKYVLLTHAHIDHCGLLPKLLQENFCGLVYATRATRDLTEIMLLDSAKVNGTPDDIERIKSINWSILDNDPGFTWGRVIRMAEGLRFSILRSSHILGACCISVSWMLKDREGNFDKNNEKNIFFSGDVGPQSDSNPYLPLLKSGHNPFPNTNYIVTEATYGGRKREAVYQCAETRRKQLAETIFHTVYNKKGKVIIPAFSLHRTQELMSDLHWLITTGWDEFAPKDLVGEVVDEKYESPLRICVDSPLGHKVAEAYQKYLFERSPNGKYKYYKGDPSAENSDKYETALNDLLSEWGACRDKGNLIRLFTSGVKSTQQNRRNQRNRGKLKKLDPAAQTAKKVQNYSVFVASAGMCDAGPVLEYLEQLDNDPANTIILTGYQAAGTAGRKLMDRATLHGPPTKEMLFGKAEVVDLSGFYSAHADQDMLLDNIFNLGGRQSNTPAKVLINHGDTDSKKALEDAIRKRAERSVAKERAIIDVKVADSQWLNLDTGEYLPEVTTSKASYQVELDANMAVIKSELKELKKILNRLMEKVAA